METAFWSLSRFFDIETFVLGYEIFLQPLQKNYRGRYFVAGSASIANVQKEQFDAELDFKTFKKTNLLGGKVKRARKHGLIRKMPVFRRPGRRHPRYTCEAADLGGQEGRFWQPPRQERPDRLIRGQGR